MKHAIIEMYRDTSCAEQIHVWVCAPAFGQPVEPRLPLWPNRAQRVVLNDGRFRIVALVYNSAIELETIKSIAREIAETL